MHHLVHCFTQERGNIGGRVRGCPPNYDIGWAANHHRLLRHGGSTHRYIQSTNIH